MIESCYDCVDPSGFKEAVEEFTVVASGDDVRAIVAQAIRNMNRINCAQQRESRPEECPRRKSSLNYVDVIPYIRRHRLRLVPPPEQ